jgi:hypothetical protein
VLDVNRGRANPVVANNERMRKKKMVREYFIII